MWKHFLLPILENDIALVKKLLKKDPGLATRRVERAKLYETSIFHWLYVGDRPVFIGGSRLSSRNRTLARVCEL